jgi:hypothetical protein
MELRNRWPLGVLLDDVSCRYIHKHAKKGKRDWLVDIKIIIFLVTKLHRGFRLPTEAVLARLDSAS